MKLYRVGTSLDAEDVRRREQESARLTGVPLSYLRETGVLLPDGHLAGEACTEEARCTLQTMHQLGVDPRRIRGG